MTVVLAGRLKKCNFLFTDAIAVDVINGIDKFTLENKIHFIQSSEQYFTTMVGESYLMNAFSLLNQWTWIKSKKSDNMIYNNIDDALFLAKKIKDSNNVNGAYSNYDLEAYFASKNDLFKICFDSGSYKIIMMPIPLKENEIEINYGGYIERMPFDCEINNLYEKLKNLAEEFHNKKKTD